MLDRLIGVITLKAPVYKEIAEDKSATTTAAIIVVVMALINGILGGIILTMVGSAVSAGTATAAVNPVTYAIRTVISAIISWLIGGWVIAFVSKTFFGGKTDTGEMLRVFGFTQVFQIIGIVPCLGTIVALILSLVAAVIGIREASEFDTTKAILTAVVAFVILLIVGILLGTVLALVGLV